MVFIRCGRNRQVIEMLYFMNKLNFTKKIYYIVIMMLLFTLICIGILWTQNGPLANWFYTYVNHFQVCEPKRRLPGCIIIGTPKSGTKALLEFIGIHPKVFIAKGEPKFFHSKINYAKGFDWYLKKMPLSCQDTLTIEKSPEYYYSKDAAERIHQMNSSVKLMVIVKDPIERAISDYTMRRVWYSGRKEENITFEELSVDTFTGEINMRYMPIFKSVYYNFIKIWLDLFPLKQMHFVDGNNLVINPGHEIDKVQKFLDLPTVIAHHHFVFNKTKGFYCIRSFKQVKCLPQYKGIKHPAVNKGVIRKLTRFFKPYNEKFFRIIGKRFYWDRI